MAYLEEAKGAKRHAPAALRNREPILGILKQELPEWGLVLELASGSGEHALYFAEHMRGLEWQPSDPDPQALASIAAYHAEYNGEGGGVNLRRPVQLDAASPNWPVERADAILCINMVHISPWEATAGLFRGAAQILSGKNLPLVLYGPYFEQQVEPAPSNLQFDTSLRARDPRWGIRDAEKVDTLASEHGFTRSARYEMPANNLMLVYRTA
jgi:SAM-dependent methyltransferase